MTNLITPTTGKTNKTFKSRNNCKNIYTSNIVNPWETVKSKRNRYRGRGRINKRDNSFSILLINLRGYKSKETSLKKIIKTVQPSAVLLNETLLSGRMKVSLFPYTTWCKNRTEKGGGGVSTSVGEKFKDSAIGAGEGKGDDEYLITRLDCFNPALNIINCYGEQRKTRKEDVEEKWARIKK